MFAGDKKKERIEGGPAGSNSILGQVVNVVANAIHTVIYVTLLSAPHANTLLPLLRIILF